MQTHFFVNLDQFHANIDPNQVNKLIFCQKFYNVNAWLRYFWEEKLGFPKFSKTSFLKNWASRAELFDQKLEPKTELSEPSLGSGATLIPTKAKNTKVLTAVAPSYQTIT